MTENPRQAFFYGSVSWQGMTTKTKGFDAKVSGEDFMYQDALLYDIESVTIL